MLCGNKQNLVSRRSRGFTLLEVMVSVAIALVLMLGINEVFVLTSHTVGAGQAMSGIQSNMRAASGVIADDSRSSAVSDGPFFLIRYSQIEGWRNRRDFEGDAKGTKRSFRSDRLAFFTRGKYRRVTGDVNFIDNLTSTEAYVWYGHLKLPGPNKTGLRPPDPLYYKNSNFKWPGPIQSNGSTEGPDDNPNNFFASQWILGRFVMLLAEKDAKNAIGGSTTSFIDSNNQLAPLSENSQSNGSPKIQNEWGRYDVGAGGIDEYGDRLRKVIDKKSVAKWWEAVGGFYYQGDPYPVRSFDPATVAAMAPIFLAGCTDFIVEFAGDFSSQGADGKITNVKTDSAGRKYSEPDGLVDYYVDAGGVRKVQWFGLPRADSWKGTDVKTLGSFLKDADIPASCERLSDTGALTYVAWGPDTDDAHLPRPKMLRITLLVDDSPDRHASESRLGAAQPFELVIPLQ